MFVASECSWPCSQDQLLAVSLLGKRAHIEVYLGGGLLIYFRIMFII